MKLFNYDFSDDNLIETMLEKGRYSALSEGFVQFTGLNLVALDGAVCVRTPI